MTAWNEQGMQKLGMRIQPQVQGSVLRRISTTDVLGTVLAQKFPVVANRNPQVCTIDLFLNINFRFAVAKLRNIAPAEQKIVPGNCRLDGSGVCSLGPTRLGAPLRTVAFRRIVDMLCSGELAELRYCLAYTELGPALPQEQ